MSSKNPCPEGRHTLESKPGEYEWKEPRASYCSKCGERVCKNLGTAYCSKTYGHTGNHANYNICTKPEWINNKNVLLSDSDRPDLDEML